MIILRAYGMGASDIHIEPYTDKDTVIRFRVDGDCKKIMEIPKKFKNALCSRIKIMCGLDIAERRLPQDGKIKFKNFGPRDIELRVAVIPTVGQNEDVVMRILAASKPIPLEKIGMIEPVYEGVQVAINKPYGIFLAVGPTGSGKTTTLHSILGAINQEDTKIWTAEDPVEITQYGLRQVQCHPKIGYDFSRAMRAFLRGDPDIVMIGEMRDLETAAIGIEASLTGHLVFSTLHTNNAPETVIRLLDLGIDPFSFGDALLGVLAQRLIKTVCKECKEEYIAPREEVDHMIEEMGGMEGFQRTGIDPNGEIQLFRPKGCPTCNGSGFKGRMGIHELLLTSPEMKRLILSKAKAVEIRAQAVKQGMFTLKQDGIIKVLSGHSVMREVLRVCID
jgi:type II secretory ATPase GspE/PulE/Tfp pilus assembly ATPase PilB-like protein